MPVASSSQMPRRSSSPTHCVFASLVFRCFRERMMRSVRSRLRFSEAARHSFGRTTGASRPCSSLVIECTPRLRDPTAQPRKLGGQIVFAHQSARLPRPYPPASIGERWKVVVEEIELQALPRCPCSAGRLVVGGQHDRPAGLARISPPEDAQPVALGSRLGTLNAIQISRQMRGRQPRPFGYSASAVAEAARSSAHPGCLAGLAQAIESCAARHLAVQPIAEPRAANHEVVALRLGLKSEDAAVSWISPASGRIHDATFSLR